MSVKYGSGKGKFVGQSLVYPFPIPLDATQHNGAVIVAEDGQLYYSNGSDWVIPTEEVEISRPSARVPTTSTEQTQLRLSAFRSPAGLTQVGVLFEISVNGVDFDGAEQRLITDEFASTYQLLYPEDGFQPGDDVFWRGKYLGSDGAQSEFSIPYRQTFPDLITEPTSVTRADAISGTITVSEFESPPVFALAYFETQTEFYEDGDEPGVDAPLQTVVHTSGAVTTIPSNLPAGARYLWRARYGGRVSLGSPVVYSNWSTARGVVAGAGSMILEFDLELATARTVALPLAGAVNVTVDWGDGTSNTYMTAGIKTKTYASGVGQTVLVTITGTMTSYGDGSITSAQQQGLTRIENWGFGLGLTSLKNALFRTSESLIYVSPSLPETVTNLNGFMSFSMANPDLSQFVTSNINDISELFYSSPNFNTPINGWDTSKVTNMRRVFRDAIAFNQPIGGWNTENVTNFSEMFQGASNFNQDIGSWDVSKGVSFATMLSVSVSAGESFNNGGSPSIDNWDMSSAESLVSMFSGARNFNQPIGSWNVSNVIRMDNMLKDCRSFQKDLNSWDVSSVESMAGMFSGSNTAIGSLYNQPIGNWDVSNVMNMSQMFQSNTAFNQPIGNWDLSSVTTVGQMFDSALSFDQPIAEWDVSNVRTMDLMFRSAPVFNQPIGDWDLRSAGVTMPTFSITGMSEENYSRTLIGWANNLVDNEGPYDIVLNLSPTRLYNANNYVPGDRFTNATDARAFLVGGRVVEVAGASDADATYTYNGTTQTYDAVNDWYFAILATSWALYDDTDTLQATGTGTAPGNGPQTATAWDGVLSAANVLRTGAGWTITGDASA